MAQSAASTLQDGTNGIANGIVPMNPETLQQLNGLVASAEALKRAGYVVEPLTDDDLEQKKRCLRCGVRGKTPAIRKSNSPTQN
jgi:RNA exonuclease 1